MTDTEPIITLRPRATAATGVIGNGHDKSSPTIYFNRQELSQILAVYGRKVAAGEWRDYAIEMSRDKAVFSIFRKTSEWPLLRIEKVPKLARKQGAYSVVAASGMILKRGPDLRHVLDVLEKDRIRLVR